MSDLSDSVGPPNSDEFDRISRDGQSDRRASPRPVFNRTDLRESPVNALGGRLKHVFARVAPGGGAVRFELLTGAATDVPGLVVATELTEDGAGFTGAWRVFHEASGRAVSPPYGSPDEAARAASRLGAVPGARWERVCYAEAGLEAEVDEAARLALEPTLLLAAG